MQAKNNAETFILTSNFNVIVKKDNDNSNIDLIENLSSFLQKSKCSLEMLVSPPDPNQITNAFIEKINAAILNNNPAHITFSHPDDDSLSIFKKDPDSEPVSSGPMFTSQFEADKIKQKLAAKAPIIKKNIHISAVQDKVEAKKISSNK